MRERLGGELRNIQRADYCISHVRYNSEKTHIDKVQLRKDLGNDFGSLETWTRANVISYLDLGYSFCTMTKGINGWEKEQQSKK